ARTASYLLCRLYLLSIILIAGLISSIQMRVYPGEVTTVEIVEENTPAEYFEPASPLATPSQRTVTLATEEEKIPLSKTDLLLIIYVIVAALLLVRYLYHLYKIFDLSRWGTITKEGSIRLVRNNRVSSPFSYFKNIYLNRKLEGETLHVVLQHEKCHIEYRHYIDALIIELFSILLWFNPFVWLVKRELRDIHEFQVDNAILENGLEVSKYQSIIFAELMGYSPNIANGFHNSLIKKRFIMMMNKRTVKLKRLRKLIVAPLILLLFVLFSFTSKEDIVNYRINSSTTQLDSVSLRTALTNTTEQIIGSIDSSKVPSSVINRFSKIVGHNIHQLSQEVIKYKGTDSLDYKPTTGAHLETTIDDQIVVSKFHTENERIQSIECNKENTLVTVLYYIKKNTLIIHSSQTTLIDARSNDIYKIRKVLNNIPMDKQLNLSKFEGKYVTFTFEFPPLKPDVTHVQLCTYDPEFVPYGKKDDFKPHYSSKILELEKYKKIDYNFTILTNEQMPLVEKIYGGGSKLISVTKEGDETLVTFAMNAQYDPQWVRFSSGWVIRDCKTHQKYHIKRVERGIQLDSVNLAIGKKSKCILFTMVFPALPEKTEKIDIMEVPHPNDIRNPRSSEKICWYNINRRKFQSDNDNTISNGRYTHPANRLVTEISSAEKPKIKLIIDNNLATKLEITLSKDQLYTIPKTYAIRDVVSGKLFRAQRVIGCNFNTTTLGKKGDKITVLFDNLTYG
ncbi:MAG: M56 family metallopeptidase, partial [Rikenellaceae bacterium]